MFSPKVSYAYDDGAYGNIDEYRDGQNVKNLTEIDFQMTRTIFHSHTCSWLCSGRNSLREIPGFQPSGTPRKAKRLRKALLPPLVRWRGPTRTTGTSNPSAARSRAEKRSPEARQRYRYGWNDRRPDCGQYAPLPPNELEQPDDVDDLRI